MKIDETDESNRNLSWFERGQILKMISFKWIIIYGSLAPFFIMITLLYILGVARYVTDFEENTCEMTYMFEYPQYVRISLKNDIEEKYPRFGLYAYGEGILTEKLRRMHFSGIPVLFIPGNAGSHEQVRSIASVSLRKSRTTSFHFDFFTVSFSKDYSALYGGVLMEQTVYVSHCIKAILALYKGKMDNVVLIGHSMGGLVAKGALLLAPDMNASFANMIINLATPHTPFLVFDSVFANYYYELERHLHKIKDAGVKVVSVGGGPRDILVPSMQAFDRMADINVLSTSIPAVWKSTDHLSILWCKQLVFVIVRSLFDSVNHLEKPPKITSNPDLKMKSLSYHFLQYTSGKKLYHYPDKVRFETDAEWVSIPQQYVWNNNGVKRSSTIYLVVELFHKSDFLTIDAINLQNKDWLFVCSALKKQEQKRTCEWGWSLTNKTRLLPDPLYRSRRTVDLNLREIKYPHITHAIVKLTPDDLEKQLTVNFDSYFYNNRMESTRNRFLHPKYLFGFRGPNLIETVKGSVRYYVTLPNIIDALTIEFKSPNCVKHHAIVELVESSNVGSTQSRIFTNIDDGPKTMKMQTLYGRSNDTASLRVTLEPECIYMINIQPGGIIDKISCRVRDRWPLLYTAIISLLLLFVSIRIHCKDSDMLPTIIITIILSFVFNVTYETCIALCIIGISAVGVCCSVIFLGSVAHGIAVRFLARAIAFSVTWSDWLLSGLNQLPYITTIFVQSLIPTTCAALSMLISVFLHFLKLTRMYEDYLEDILMAPLQHFNWFKRWKNIRSEEENNESNTSQKSISQEIYNHLLLFLLYSFAAIPAIPSVLVWAKNFSYDMRLSTEDPIHVLSWTILAGCSTLGIVQISPNHKGYRSLILSNILRFTSWVILSMTAAPRPSFYQWCMPPIIAIVVTLITLNSMIP